ncbi:FtsX-like permease family protein [Streptomyces sp. NPDC001833]|uniref:ABC transporter permease n=1 Tax=Streptomyces sp. NPDC001833 TaxID=3154658 RepID=UPI003316DFC9
MYRTALRNLLAHKGRLLMTTLAIMLSTAFVAGTWIFSDSAKLAARNSITTSYDDVSVLVSDIRAGHNSAASKKGEKPPAQLTAATVKELSALPGVRSARGVVSGFLGVADKNGDLISKAGLSRGANYVPDASGKDPRYPIVSGRGPTRSGEIALDEKSAQRAGYKVGDSVRIASNGPAEEVKLTGTFTTKEPMVTAGGTLALLDTANAQRLMLTSGQFSAVSLKAKSGMPENDLLKEVKGDLANATDLELQTSVQLNAEQAERVSQSGHSLRVMLMFFAAVALFVSLFLIVNTFVMLITQRIKELALLRAVGASRSQIARSVLTEALVIGFTGSVGGLLLGVGVGAGLRALLKAVKPSMPTGPLVFSATAVLVTLGVGTVATVVSALLPAVRASRIPPVAAMSSGDQPATQRGLLVRNVFGGALFVIGTAVVLVGGSTQGAAGLLQIALGSGLCTVGLLFLLPMLSRPVIALAAPLLVRLFRSPGKLARLNAVRNPRRTATTAGALAVGLTMITAMTVVGASVTQAVDQTVSGSLKADYSISMANSETLSTELTEAVQKASGVTAASPVSYAYWTMGKTSRQVEGLDADSYLKLVTPTMNSGSADALKQGRILVSSTVAQAAGLSAGSTVRVSYPDKSTGTLTVGGVFQDSKVLSTVLVPNSVVNAHQSEPYIGSMLVNGEHGASDAMQKVLEAATGHNPAIEVVDKAGMQADFSSSITSALNLLYLLLGMSILVACLGVINTMAMSVAERRREIGMLRAIGMDRGGVKRMIQLESVVISLFGAATGMILGTFLASGVNRTFEGAQLDSVPTILPYGRMLLFLLLAGLVGVIAAQWPARQAARLDILGSIQTA